MSLARRIEVLEDSAVLGLRTSVRLMELYVQEAMPEYKVDVLDDQAKRAFTVRVVFEAKAASMSFGFDDNVFHFRMGIDRLMDKIQEELDASLDDSDPRGEPEDAQVHTKPKPGAYAPSMWARKVAGMAMK